MTSTYDHRVIQGAESGQFLQVVEAYLQGEHDFYEQVFADLGAQLGATPQPPAPAAAAAVQRDAAPAPAPAADGSGRRGAAAGGPGRDVAAQGAPHARPPGREARPARVRARGRPGARSRDGRPDARADGADPGEDPAHLRPGRDARRRAPAPARDLLRHDRLRDRAHRLAPPAHVAAGEDRVRRVPHAADQRRAAHAAAPAHPGRLARALHAQGLPGPEAVLDRGPGHDRPDARRDDPARRRQRRARGRHRHGAPRPAQRPRPLPRAARTRRSSASSRAPRRSRRSRRSRRAAPATSSTTTARRAPTSCPTSPRSSCGSSPTRATSSTSARSSRAPRARSRRRARARTRTWTTTPRSRSILHGDAAFPGQGVVAETFNLQGLDGYTVGGALHLIQNNQVGFTTDPDDSRSTRWASDLAKGFDVPIIHVNADDVAACVAAVRLAFAFRQEFGHDVLIDLIGYRRFGHNEADEPAYTQPEMAAQDQGTRRRCASSTPTRLVEQGVVDPGGGRRASARRSGRTSPSATASSRPSWPRPTRSSRPAATSSTARRRPRSRPRCRPSGCSGSTTTCCGSPRASPSTRS